MLIQDVIPRVRNLVARRPTTGSLVTELHRRGVTVQDIFGMYYAIEAEADHRTDQVFGDDERGQHGRQLTVGDAELAGHATLPSKPIERQPF